MCFTLRPSMRFAVPAPPPPQPSPIWVGDLHLLKKCKIFCFLTLTLEILLFRRMLSIPLYAQRTHIGHEHRLCACHDIQYLLQVWPTYIYVLQV